MGTSPISVLRTHGEAGLRTLRRVLDRLGSGFLPPHGKAHWRGKMSFEGLSRERQMGVFN